MAIPLRLLLVEDSEDDALLLLRELRRGDFELTYDRVTTPEAMSLALDKREWDIVVSDYSLPHFSGPAALVLLKQKGLDLPFIIVSGTIGEEVAVAAMKDGAHDYIMKGNLRRLMPAVERGSGRQRSDGRAKTRKRLSAGLRNSYARRRNWRQLEDWRAG